TVADLNGDGNPDLVSANAGTVGTGYGNLSLFLGNGNGTFTKQPDFAAGGVPYTVTAVDVSGDGKPDLLYPINNGSRIEVALGNGNGSFRNPVGFYASQTPYFVAVGDVNGDGKPD